MNSLKEPVIIPVEQVNNRIPGRLKRLFAETNLKDLYDIHVVIMRKTKSDIPADVMPRFIEEVENVIKKCYENTAKKVTLIPPSDWEALVTSYLAEKHPDMVHKTPSLLSVFICTHKYYARKLILKDSPYNIPYETIDPNVTEYELLKILRERIIYNTEELKNSIMRSNKVFFKPQLGAHSDHAFLLNLDNKDEIRGVLLKFSKLTRESYDDYVKPILPFVTEEISVQLPDLTRPTWIAEKFAGIPTKDMRVFCADFFITQSREVIPWCLTENLYFKKYPLCYMGQRTFNEDERDTELDTNIWNMVKYTAENMIDVGYTSQFVNIELFAFPDNSVAVMEINTRLNPWGINSFRKIFDNGERIIASVNDKLGKPVPMPKKKKKTLGMFLVSTRVTGMLSTAVDIQLGESTPNFIFDFQGDEFIDSGEGIQPIGFLEVVEDNFSDCLKEFYGFMGKFLKDKNKSPWFEHNATGIPLVNELTN